ncbi:peptidase U61 LD-carboxypeptidase A [Pseudopedobacter saltans DSM 12145]|uniref:Peptidase U61 LD-carboxypeptidase A n=1 Tax=Pseudopedobacter saltans (strain ATCC 51119 / DSM 12145 / JCM 21818 / CCUG 39354 / LMG 10337 / NBRC 100064 / NCIMB 13643) TaxID=762903 RepID=F0SAR0_PSESL|nr:LD-carboxypeptidase [Pseudopedobacter saltans]ADY53681.1 peptidase U61 LD-carboxypeptidase A [Pseudopedobacter saltans DSM 12145]
MIQPPYLKKGDKVAISCPAKFPLNPMNQAVELMESWGLEVIIGETVNSQFHQFAGDDKFRAQELQTFIDDNSVKAIFAARGGYGSVRIIDSIDFSNLLSHPKWIVGFSDITVFHGHLNRLGIQSIHGQMPANIPDSTAGGIESLRKALFGEKIEYPIAGLESLPKAPVIGGNLSILLSVLGSESDPVYDGKILFIEDVAEYYYAVDRMLRALDRAGKLENLKGLLVGGFTAMKDNDNPFGFSIEEIVMGVVGQYNYPVVFNFPAGHIDDNWAIVFGKKIL